MWTWPRKFAPIGIDIGSATLKMVQLTRDGGQLVAAGCWSLPQVEDEDNFGAPRRGAIVEGIRELLRRHPFRGRCGVVSLSDRQLSIHNVRVPPPVLGGPGLEETVLKEAAERLVFPVAEAEIRFLPVGDVRQSDRMVKEIIVLAAPRDKLGELVETVDEAGLQVTAMDAEPCALVRSYTHQYRRAEDAGVRTLLVHIGHSRTVALISDGENLLFVKYIPIGGRSMDEAVCRHLSIDASSAATLRRHHGDRRTAGQDPEVARTVWEAVRPAVEQLVSELAMCCRYYSVTFRGRPLSRVVVGGGEATPGLTEILGQRLKLEAMNADPLQKLTRVPRGLPAAAWDVAMGLSLRGVTQSGRDESRQGQPQRGSSAAPDAVRSRAAEMQEAAI